MTAFITATVEPCPDPGCIDGKIVVDNAWTGESRVEPCDKCEDGTVTVERFLG